jgi:glutamate synthase domain-containing protein 2
VFTHNCLLGAGLRERIKLGAGGRIITAFDMLRAFALGADWCNSARGFMFALGCVQSLSCHTDRCPTGVATQNPWRQKAIVVPLKAERVARFHNNTLKALAELVGAAGLERPGAIHRSMIMHRKPPHEGQTFAELYPELPLGSLLRGEAEASYQQAWALARSDSFRAA